MSRLRISHETLYSYARPVRLGPHRLVLRPREGHELQVERMRFDIKPDHQIEWHRDLFGNSVATVLFLAEADELRIFSEVDVRRFEMPRIPEAARVRVPFPVIYDEIEAPAASVYLQSLYYSEQPRIREWAAQVFGGNIPPDALAVVDQLNRAIRASIQYARREEKGVQSPAETLDKALGSCRDMATLLMEACRALGIATRFASGYLDCAASQAGRASTHAWAEVYLPSQGWVGFDPTLAEAVGGKHITLGLSNHPRGVMPVTGSFFGAKSDYREMKVSVKFTVNDSCSPQPGS